MSIDPQAAEPQTPPHKLDPAEQSRINGAKSKGPTSPAGKARSSRNAIRHGLTASDNVLLTTENPAEYKELFDSYIHDFRPATKTELRLIQKLTNIDWRQERGILMETCLHNMGTALTCDQVADRFNRIDGIGFFTEAWKQSCKKDSNSFDLLRRYMSTLQTQFDKTLGAFLKLEARRLDRHRQGTDLDQEHYVAPEFETIPEAQPEEELVPVETVPVGKPQVHKQNPYPVRIPLALFPVEPGRVKKVNYLSKLPKPPLPKAA